MLGNRSSSPKVDYRFRAPNLISTSLHNNSINRNFGTTALNNLFFFCIYNALLILTVYLRSLSAHNAITATNRCFVTSNEERSLKRM